MPLDAGAVPKLHPAPFPRWFTCSAEPISGTLGNPPDFIFGVSTPGFEFKCRTEFEVRRRNLRAPRGNFKPNFSWKCELTSNKELTSKFELTSNTQREGERDIGKYLRVKQRHKVLGNAQRACVHHALTSARTIGPLGKVWMRLTEGSWKSEPTWHFERA